MALAAACAVAVARPPNPSLSLGSLLNRIQLDLLKTTRRNHRHTHTVAAHIRTLLVTPRLGPREHLPVGSEIVGTVTAPTAVQTHPLHSPSPC